MSTNALSNRHGKTVPQLGALAKRTGEHAGIPTEAALYIITAFIDVLADEIVTNGGASIPGIVTFYTKNTKKSIMTGSRNGARTRYDKDLAVRVQKPLKNMHRLQTIYCRDGERVITPNTWRDFLERYRTTLQNNNLGSGVVEATRARKTIAPVNSGKKEDYVELKNPISCDYFKTLIKEMNHSGIYDVTYHRDTKKELEEGDYRLLRMSDITTETVPYIHREKIEKVTRLKELKTQGKIKGDYLEPDPTRVRIRNN